MAPRSRLVKIAAEKFSNALSKALSLHPNKFLKTQFARRMDLVLAQEEAKKHSLKSAHKQFVVLLKSGDFEVENALSIEPKMDIYSVWHKGKKVEGATSPKIKLSPQDEEESPVAKAPKRAELPSKKELSKEVKQTNKETKTKIQNEEIMKTETKKSPAKKVVAKKEAPEKLAKAAKSTTPAKGKKPASIKKIEGAKIVAISIKDMRAGLKKGIKYYDPQGVSQNENYLSTRANQEYIREGMQELKPSK
jgi:outer membrane biosynthesis protein TonB